MSNNEELVLFTIALGLLIGAAVSPDKILTLFIAAALMVIIVGVEISKGNN